MLASAAETGNGRQQMQHCIVCGANERQHDGKCSSCGGECTVPSTPVEADPGHSAHAGGDAQMLDRPDRNTPYPAEDAAASAGGGTDAKWFDKHRQCEDGSAHFGELELITWGGEEAGWELGWGRAQVSEVDFMKKQYEEEFGGDDEKLFGYWPQGFRRVGATIAGKRRRVHDGKPRLTDACFAHSTGMSIPEDLYYSKVPERRGLHLSRGPDPRSHGFHSMMSMHNFNNYEIAM
ncbi:uncharacterized protein PG998_012950 [Apiospora kogelbergensis]|uniref:uncharacterized protein n=1 Tax=Apiospora kogelbergensis TaxID=1337665 RepID=UPI00312D3EB7